MGIASSLFIGYLLLIMGVEQAGIVFELASIVGVLWLIYIVLRVIFPVLFRRKKREVK